MACPFFLPVSKIKETGWTHAPRWPLGGRFRGWCKARSEAFEAEGDPCNRGYARGECERFPAEAAADAVRFSAVAEEPQKLIYVIERAHVPLEHGCFDDPSSLRNEILEAQARAFAEGGSQSARSASPE